MARGIRRDSEGVASSVATMFTLLLIVLFLQIVLVDVIPRQQYEAEWNRSREALAALEMFRSLAALAVVRGAQFSVPVPMGADPVSLFARPTDAELRFEASASAETTVSFHFVPRFSGARVSKMDQDVILLMDSSGSMVWNDPQRLRISGAWEYLDQLEHPDRVAIVDFDSRARFTRENVNQGAHHLFTDGHDGRPDYEEPKRDLDTIDQSGGTNFGQAIQIANDEFAAYGDTGHEWVMILLTDGQNNAVAQDNLARAEAQRAKAYGIAIYTIGLGSEPDGALLSEIATTTGGTYYAAPDASSIRWIYFEISRRYRGSFQCGRLVSEETAAGSLSLDLRTAQFAGQTFSLEGGAVAIRQADGEILRDGFPYEVTPLDIGSGTLSLTLFSFVGEPFVATGTEYQILTGRVAGRDVVEQTMTRVPLGEVANAVNATSDSLQSWTDQGAASPQATAVIRGQLSDASRLVVAANGSMASGDPTTAKFHVDRAQVVLSEAVASLEDGRSRGQIQGWLADSTRDEIGVSACRLDQWRNWYEGITVTVASPFSAAWRIWVNETSRNLVTPTSLGYADDQVLFTFHAIDRLVLDRRTIELSVAA